MPVGGGHRLAGAHRRQVGLQAVDAGEALKAAIEADHGQQRVEVAHLFGDRVFGEADTLGKVLPGDERAQLLRVADAGGHGAGDGVFGLLVAVEKAAQDRLLYAAAGDGQLGDITGQDIAGHLFILQQCVGLLGAVDIGDREQGAVALRDLLQGGLQCLVLLVGAVAHHRYRHRLQLGRLVERAEGKIEQGGHHQREHPGPDQGRGVAQGGADALEIDVAKHGVFPLNPAVVCR